MSTRTNLQTDRPHGILGNRVSAYSVFIYKKITNYKKMLKNYICLHFNFHLYKGKKDKTANICDFHFLFIYGYFFNGSLLNLYTIEYRLVSLRLFMLDKIEVA